MRIEELLADREKLDLVFYALYQRSPTAEEYGQLRDRSVRDVVLGIRSDPKFAEHLPNLFQPYTCRYGMAHVDEADEFYSRVEGSPFSAASFDELVKGPTWDSEYLTFHRQRFKELHGLVASLDRGRPIRRVLEVSTMMYTTGLWKHYLKELAHLSTIDLPAQQGGPTPESVTKQGVDVHMEVDLNKVDLDTLALDLTRQGGGYDLIVATEVIEHLQRDFSEVASFVLKCLNPNGVAIVSTPNAVNETHLLFAFNGRNANHRFLGYNANHAGHFHFREYSMAELREDVAKVGGRSLLQAFSTCWLNDRERFAAPERYHLRSNMYLAFGHPDCSFAAA